MDAGKMKISRRSFITAGVAAVGCLSFGMPVFADSDALDAQGIGAIVTITNLASGIKYELSSENTKTSIEKLTADSTAISIISEVAVPSPQTRDSMTDGGCTTRVTLNIDVIQSGSCYRMTGMSGSFQLLDSAFSISDKYVQAGNYDYGQSANHIKSFTNVPNTFSYPGFSNWVNPSYPPALIAAYAQCNVRRDGDPWRIRCYCKAIEEGTQLI